MARDLYGLAIPEVLRWGHSTSGFDECLNCGAIAKGEKLCGRCKEL
jgi:hypothetical protein